MFSGTETLTFLGSRTWEIVLATVKKIRGFKTLNCKQSFGIQKTVHAGYAKASYRKLFFHNVPSNFLCNKIYHFHVNILFRF